jgi:hypothetical protein
MGPASSSAPLSLLGAVAVGFEAHVSMSACMNEHMGACAHGRTGASRDRVRACVKEHTGA